MDMPTTIKRLLTAAAVALATTAVTASGADYQTTARKARRFFDDREWASAQALYGLILDERPDADSAYVRSIVASSMLHHDDHASRLLAEAMNAGMSFSRLMTGVKEVSFAIGEPSVYEDFLERSQIDCPWLARAIDDELLHYYLFRDDGPQIVVYANKMLAGLPDSVKYLSALARGYARSGDFGRATATWERILEIDPRNYDALLCLGNYFSIAGRDAEALGYLRRAEEIRSTPYVSAQIERLSTK